MPLLTTICWDPPIDHPFRKRRGLTSLTLQKCRRSNMKKLGNSIPHNTPKSSFSYQTIAQHHHFYGWYEPFPAMVCSKKSSDLAPPGGPHASIAHLLPCRRGFRTWAHGAHGPAGLTISQKWEPFKHQRLAMVGISVFQPQNK